MDTILTSLLINDEDIKLNLEEVDQCIRSMECIKDHRKEERYSRTNEQQFSLRIKETVKSLGPLVHKTVMIITID